MYRRWLTAGSIAPSVGSEPDCLTRHPLGAGGRSRAAWRVARVDQAKIEGDGGCRRVVESVLKRGKIELNAAKIGETDFVARPGAQGREGLDIAMAGVTGFYLARFTAIGGDQRAQALVIGDATVRAAQRDRAPIAATPAATETARPFQTAILSYSGPGGTDGTAASGPIARDRGGVANSAGLEQRDRRQLSNRREALGIETKGGGMPREAVMSLINRGFEQRETVEGATLRGTVLAKGVDATSGGQREQAAQQRVDGLAG